MSRLSVADGHDEALGVVGDGDVAMCERIDFTVSWSQEAVCHEQYKIVKFGGDGHISYDDLLFCQL